MYSEQCAVRFNSGKMHETAEQNNFTSWRWICVNVFRLTCLKLRIRLENFKGVPDFSVCRLQ